MMNKTLYQLAYRHVKKHKKYYIFLCIFVFGMTLFYSTFTIVQKSYFYVERAIHERDYGAWYQRGIIEEPEKFDAIAKLYERSETDHFQYAYLYLQGYSEDNEVVAYAKQDFFDITAIRLIDGYLPQNENEILVSSESFEKNHYQLNQLISLNIVGLLEKQYQIVGVVQKSQENYFPDVYTMIDNHYTSIEMYSDRSLFMAGNEEQYSHTRIYMDINNQYSYDHIEVMNFYYIAQMDISVLLESLLLTLIVLIAFTSISMKQRAHEFALLRGIGMTSRQLMTMTMYEYITCTLIAISLGILSSIGLSIIIMKMIEYLKDIYILEITVIDLFVNFILVFTFISCALCYPVIRSAHHALSGAFEGMQFHYFQVRYQKLKYQNKWRLAWRELKVNKKIHIFLIIVLGLHSSLMLMNQVIFQNSQDFDVLSEDYHICFEKNRYFNIPIENEDDIEKIENFHFDHQMIVPSQSMVPVVYDSQNYRVDSVLTSPLEYLKTCPIEGRLPQNDHEVLITENVYLYNITDSQYHYYNTALKVNDEFLLNNQKVKVVGMIKPFEVQDVSDFQVNLNPFVTSGIYVTPSKYKTINGFYEKIDIQIFYNDYIQRDQYLHQIRGILGELYYRIMDYGEIKPTAVIDDFNKPILNPYVLIITLGISILLCYSFNKYEMLDRKHEYQLYRLIGMTQKDMIKKQLCKGIIIFSIIEVMNLLFILLECLYLNIWLFPLEVYLILGSFIFIICLAVYSLPLLGMLKKNSLENIKSSE